jgi:hypothetical protein
MDGLAVAPQSLLRESFRASDGKECALFVEITNALSQSVFFSSLLPKSQNFNWSECDTRDKTFATIHDNPTGRLTWCFRQAQKTHTR